MSAIKIAHLALKHRQNRNHKMRIVMFIGSPIDNLDSAELTKIAKKLKKEKVQCDVICFGEADSENSQIMGQFVDTLNGKWVQFIRVCVRILSHVCVRCHYSPCRKDRLIAGEIS
ncbi:hypothetical protein Y032_0086g1988 [Ancylostoma ceylanicum]|nr:hypothetical protein Y032_0086g1988 [Ancylostoma ceylanicum]